MTRPWSLWTSPSGVSFLKFCGKETPEKFDNPLTADARCNELNKDAEAWRVMRNKEEREARRKA